MASTLLVKHLPSVLSEDSITEFFQHYGAIEVKIMQGKMKGSVYVTCKDNEEAKKVLLQLQGLKFLDKTLTAEFAKEKTEPIDPTQAATAATTKTEPSDSTQETDKQAFEPIAPSLGVNYPSNPLLEYRYPNPNPLILTNILNAMTARPKFYTQVLHLMNKMNLPPPFGPPAPALPMLPEGMKRKRDNDVEEEEEESEDEDELEDVPSAKRPAPSAPAPAGSTASSAALAQKLIGQQQQQLQEQLMLQKQQHQEQEKQQQQQQQQLQQLQQQLQQQTQQLQQQAQTLAFNPSAFNTPLPVPTPLPPPISSTAMPTASPSKKQPAIQIVLRPDQAAVPLPFLLPSQQQQATTLQLQQQQQQIQATQQQIQQQQQLLQQQQQLLQQLNPGGPGAVPQSKYATAEELAANRATLEEIRAIDKKYEKGETTVKLYIKNLHKQVDLPDLERIFGKYFTTEQAMKDGLEIKLMKEGRMKGQAFVTFQDEELAEEAMEEVNGFKLFEKPMIIQYGKLK